MQYVTFTKTCNGNLEIALLPEGREYIEEQRADGKNIDSDEFFIDLIDHQIGNGWDVIAPELVGALTDAIILSDDAVRHSDLGSDRIESGTLYSNIDRYQLESPVAIMLRDGSVTFTQAR